MPNRKTLYAWALYDWGNSAYTTAVMAGFFPIFFKQYYAAGADAGVSTGWLGFGNAGASLFILLLAPFLGTLADMAGMKKRLLALFALLGVCATCALSLAQSGEMHLAIALYALSAIGFSGANVFYDALLPHVAENKGYEKASSLGYALGYLGGGLVFLLGVVMVQTPDTFGLADKAKAIKAAFLLTGVWWLLFTLPLLWLVKEPPAPPRDHTPLVRATLTRLRTTFAKIRRLKTALLFLIAYWFYIDGVDTVAKMAVDFGLNIGLESSDLLTALLIIQFLAFPATLFTYRLGQKIGPKRMIGALIGVYFLVVLWAGFMQSAAEFYVLAVFIAFAQGGVQALSRALYAHMTPAALSGEFFGFYNMFGKFAAILGPLLVGASALLLPDPRYAILPVLLLFVIGGYLLLKVDVERGKAEAEEF